MALLEKNYLYSSKPGSYAIAVELEFVGSIVDFTNILLNNGYWVRIDKENADNGKCIVWISEERN